MTTAPMFPQPQMQVAPPQIPVAPPQTPEVVVVGAPQMKGRFDPMTGKENPKFDPNTGVQNW